MKKDDIKFYPSANIIPSSDMISINTMPMNQEIYTDMNPNLTLQQ